MKNSKKHSVKFRKYREKTRQIPRSQKQNAEILVVVRFLNKYKITKNPEDGIMEEKKTNIGILSTPDPLTNTTNKEPESYGLMYFVPSV